MIIPSKQFRCPIGHVCNGGGSEGEKNYAYVSIMVLFMVHNSIYYNGNNILHKLKKIAHPWRRILKYVHLSQSKQILDLWRYY